MYERSHVRVSPDIFSHSVIASSPLRCVSPAQDINAPPFTRCERNDREKKRNKCNRDERAKFQRGQGEGGGGEGVDLTRESHDAARARSTRDNHLPSPLRLRFAKLTFNGYSLFYCILLDFFVRRSRKPSM